MNDPDTNPILNNPYDYPEYHWKLDDAGKATNEMLGGRRPSGAYLTVPKPEREQGAVTITEEKAEPYEQINQMRAQVQEWRNAGYPGTSNTTRNLLEYWTREDDFDNRPFFCQIDAVESTIYICDLLSKKTPPPKKSAKLSAKTAFTAS